MKNLFLALSSAILLSISWPTYGFPFFIFFSFVPLLILEDQISNSGKKRKSFRVYCFSYITFAIWNICTTGWLYNSLNPDGSHSVMAVTFPIIVNSFLMTTTFFLYHLYKKWKGKFSSLFLILIWLAFEYVHLSWEFTWPWLNLGNVFADYHIFVQWYDTFGAVGGSFWILLINVLVFRIRYKKDLKKESIIIFSVLVIPIAISFWKYYNYNPKPVGTTQVALLQPKLDPYLEKYEKTNSEIVTELLSTTDELGNHPPIDFYIAPETAIPGPGHIEENNFDNDPSIQQIKQFLSDKKISVFLTGASTFKIYPADEKGEEAAFYNKNIDRWINVYNTALQISNESKIETYHKGKLVPGVEIFPYIKVLKPLLGDAMLNMGGTVVSLGTEKTRKVFTNPYNNVKIAPIICYESIYGEYTTQYVKNGANLLSIVTNDSWWGNSQGHKHLLIYAKLRAIENRREIVRAANSGISAHINTKGDVLEKLPYDTRGILTVKASLYNQITFYAQYSSWIQQLLLWSLLFLTLHFIGNLLIPRKLKTKDEKNK